uniref:Small ribosomal subunit protein mS35 mitochondrial conserved domain-containing protein n=1 Tax=Clastoptera arizonana TaxID=38151 RepID=A0A1B6D709_9HEMI
MIVIIEVMLRCNEQRFVCFLNCNEFRVLNLKKNQSRSKVQKKQAWKPASLPPRSLKMSTDQDWTNVWPGPRTFHPATVPLPVRQGYNKLGASPSKYGNAELMKIPNFLHLTPPAILKHCKALERFCTPWPLNLEDDAKCEENFPLETITSDYCHSSPVIRDPLARIVTIRLKLSSLQLNRHARDKFLRLVGDRYDDQTDLFTLVTDRCPLRQQNYDYAMYLLTALYHESWNIEHWESEKTLEDMEYYDWESNQSYKNVLKLLNGWVPNLEINNLPKTIKEIVDEYKDAIQILFNKGEDDDYLNNYKKSSVKLLLGT